MSSNGVTPTPSNRDKEEKLMKKKLICGFFLALFCFTASCVNDYNKRERWCEGFVAHPHKNGSVHIFNENPYPIHVKLVTVSFENESTRWVAVLNPRQSVWTKLPSRKYFFRIFSIDGTEIRVCRPPH